MSGREHDMPDHEVKRDVHRDLWEELARWVARLATGPSELGQEQRMTRKRPISWMSPNCPPKAWGYRDIGNFPRGHSL
jgi:hypothetical protein